MQILTHDDIAAMNADVLLDAELGWQLLAEMDAAELDTYIEDDPHYVMFQQSADFYASVLPAEQREDWVGE